MAGVALDNGYAYDNVVLGNTIGLNAAGAALGNTNGVLIYESASGNTVGGTSSAARNIISGNSGAGIAVLLSASYNMIVGNFIGTNASGNAAVGNSIGVQIASGASGNIVGGSTSGAGNVISGNHGEGILINQANSGGNAVEGKLHRDG